MTSTTFLLLMYWYVCETANGSITINVERSKWNDVNYIISIFFSYNFLFSSSKSVVILFGNNIVNSTGSSFVLVNNLSLAEWIVVWKIIFYDFFSSCN